MRTAWLLIACARLAHAQGSGTIRGRVTDRDKHVLADVEVVVTTQAAAAVASAHTGKDGRYAITVPQPRDAYVLAFRHVGYAAISKVVRRSGTAATIDVDDVALAPRVDILQPVVTRGVVLAPSLAEESAIGATELDIGGSGGFTGDPSDIAGLISLLPGVQAAGDSGFSVLGAPPDQNRTLVDGADFGGGGVPRDAIRVAKLVTNTFDPSVGRFSGGEAVITTRSGTAKFEGTLRSQLIHPSLSWNDPRSMTSIPTLGSLSGYVSGPLHGPNVLYFLSMDMSRSATDATSLLTPRPGTFPALGVSPDTVAAATTALRTLGAPLAAHGPAQSTVVRGTAFSRVDFIRPAANRFTATTFTLSSNASWSHAPVGSVGPLSFPSTARAADAAALRLMFSGQGYLGRALDKFGLSASSSMHRSAPVLAMPAALVQVGTSFDDGRTGFSSFQLGGAGSAGSDTHDDFLTANHEISWVVDEGRHHIKLTQEAVLQRLRLTDGSNVFGTYRFTGLGDLQSNRPSAYDRSLSSIQESANDLALDASVGDIWQVVPGFDLQGGVRIDATRFGARPSFNARADSLFGLRTDRVPSDVGLSPRLGFSWRPVRPKARPVIPVGMVDVRSHVYRVYSGPIDAGGIPIRTQPSYISITGGVGAFRGTFPLSRVASLMSATGLPSARRSLACVGDATPLPDWSQDDEALPVACGDASSVFADQDQNISVLSPTFRAPVSWRGNLTVNGLKFAGLRFAPQVTYSLGRYGESHVDRNLVTTPAFAVAAEGNRPVFVPATAIDPGSGLIGPGAGRLVPDIGRVTESISDLESRTAQVSIAIAPRNPLPGGGLISGSYTLTPQRFLQRGFDGTSAGDPRDMQWVSGARPLHQFILGAGNVGTKWLRMGTRLTLSSGTGFTPMVAQDINGDGRANDRAFIPNPATTTDTSLASQMRLLLATTSPTVRRCLGGQLDAIAGANTCRTGWSARVDLTANAAPPSGFGFGGRWAVTTTLLNAGTALVGLFHLENTPFGRSSNNTFVDQRLLYVTGFDAATRSFRYRLNQQFGQQLSSIGSRGLPPFELQVGVRVRLGPATDLMKLPAPVAGASHADSIALIRADVLRRHYGPEPIASILAIGDSLGLDADQREGIRGVDRAYVAQRDSILAPVVAFAMERGNKLTSAELNAHFTAIRPQLVELENTCKRQALAFLTPAQRDNVTPLLRRLNARPD